LYVNRLVHYGNKTSQVQGLEDRTKLPERDTAMMRRILSHLQTYLDI